MPDATPKDATQKAKTVLDDMRVRVNPGFDLEVDPSENEFDYVNPVALNNNLIVLANTMVTLAEEQGRAIRDNQRAKLDRRKLERDLKAKEQQLLVDNPLEPSESKNLQTTAAAIEKRIGQTGLTAWFTETRAKVAELEDRIARNESTITTAKLYWETAEKVASNLAIHLSWIKDERRRT